MKKIGLIIFILGVLIDISAFLISNADHYRFVYSIISPSYLKGLSAIEMIADKGEIIPGSPEFDFCTKLYMQSIVRDYPDHDLSGVTIERFYHPSSVSHSLSVKKGAIVKRPLDVYLSNGIKYESCIEALQLKVDKLKENKILGSSTLLFIIGTILTVIGFILGYIESKNA